MKINNPIFALVVVLFLSGCSLFQVKTETRIIIETPSDVLLQEVTPESPPALEDYVNLQCVDKEGVWTDKFRAQSEKLDAANSQLRALQEWKTKVIQQYQKKE